jgi:hypothetical protein
MLISDYQGVRLSRATETVDDTSVRVRAAPVDGSRL